MAFEKIGKLNIHYKKIGVGPAIVFLSGRGLDLYIWMQLAQKLKNDFTCILVDHRGSGKSDTPRKAFLIENMAEDISLLMDSLKINEAVFVGQSMGGFVALQFAVDYSNKIKALVAVSTAAYGKTELLGSDPTAIKMLTRTWGSAKEILYGSLKASLGEKFLNDNPHALSNLVEERLKNIGTGRGLMYQRQATENFDIRSRLNEISCNTTIVHGEADRVISKDCGRELSNKIDNAKLISLSDIGHLPMIEATEELAKIICDSYRVTYRGRS